MTYFLLTIGLLFLLVFWVFNDHCGDLHDRCYEIVTFHTKTFCEFYLFNCFWLLFSKLFITYYKMVVQNLWDTTVQIIEHENSWTMGSRCKGVLVHKVCLIRVNCTRPCAVAEKLFFVTKSNYTVLKQHGWSYLGVNEFSQVLYLKFRLS